MKSKIHPYFRTRAKNSEQMSFRKFEEPRYSPTTNVRGTEKLCFRKMRNGGPNMKSKI